jgi:hypothetical protein
MTNSPFRTIKSFEKRLDYLLDKINEQGIDKLTHDELNWLNQSSKGVEHIEEQSKVIRHLLKNTFETFHKDYYISRNGRVVHFLNHITNIAIITVSEIGDDIYKLHVRDGFMEDIVQVINRGITIEDVKENLIEYIGEEYDMDIRKTSSIG